ncbi:MAG TPA: DUF559 domain-containing protein [Solirubrobacteraceae bacterium]|nr:DUF559 domain-containing protein [Solirubrobacteraceae bacterium]
MAIASRLATDQQGMVSRAQLLAEGVRGHVVKRWAATGLLDHRHPKSLKIHRNCLDVKVGRHEVDFLWPEHGVAIELDSWQIHGHRPAFERDRRKGLALQAAGLDLIRLSALQIRDEPFPVIAQIARSLDRATRGAA